MHRFPVYQARNYLAVLDYEFHKNRPLLLGADGQPRYFIQMIFICIIKMENPTIL